MTAGDTTRCHHCDRVLLGQRLTVPRAKTGDLAFCGWTCQEEWRADGSKP